MAGEQEKAAQTPDSGDNPRPLGGGERVVKRKAAPHTDIFDEVLTGEAHEEQSLDELAEAEEKRAQQTEKTVVAAKSSSEGKAAPATAEGAAEAGEADEAGKVAEAAGKPRGPRARKKAEPKIRVRKAPAGKTKDDEGDEDDDGDDEDDDDDEDDEDEGEPKPVPPEIGGAEAEDLSEGDWNDLFKEDDIHEEGIKAEPKEAEGDEPEGAEGEAPVGNGPAAGPKPPVPSKDEIRKQLIERSTAASQGDLTPLREGLPLKFLEDPEKGNVFIGRKKTLWKKYGYEGALLVGRVAEDELRDKQVYLDSLNPHVVFVCGARGSGKSYIMGVIAEELAKKNKNVGIVVIDPVGVFWSMKYPNKEEKEIGLMQDWGLTPEGLENLRVFIPEGIRSQTPKETYDATFTMQPSLLTSDDWCLTYGIDRFSPTGLLLEKALRKVSYGYEALDGQKVPAKKRAYSLRDLIACLETDSELNSRDKGYKQDSIRALVSRFEAAKNWGIFSDRGTPLADISKENQLTVIDTSFLDDNVTALVIGILARRLLAARKLSTRKEAAKKFQESEAGDILESEIPPTWLFIDEAHTLIPSGNVKTPATHALVEYVKQGRRPGCSLVFATQQPSAIDTKVLSQLDVMVTHKLVFDDDIKAIYKRSPTIVPFKYKKVAFIKTLPIGTALVGDRTEETSRAFIMKIRPRLSQHEGREAETTEHAVELDEKQVQQLAVNLLMRRLEEQGKADLETVNKTVQALNQKYKGTADPENVLALLKKEGIVVDEESIRLKEYSEAKPEPSQPAEGPAEGTGTGAPAEETAAGAAEEAEAEKEAESELQTAEATELLALPARVNQAQAQRLVDGLRKKRILGLLGGEETIEDLQMKYVTIWRVKYDVFNNRREFIARECFIDSMTGEFIHFMKDRFVESRGLKEIYELSGEEIPFLRLLGKKEMSLQEITKRSLLDEKKVRAVLDKLHFKRLLGKAKKNEQLHYWLLKEFDLPPHERHDLLQSLRNLPFVRAEALAKEREVYGRQEIPEVLGRLWKNVLVRKIEELHWPVWFATLKEGSRTRKIAIDGVTGRPA